MTITNLTDIESTVMLKDFNQPAASAYLTDFYYTDAYVKFASLQLASLDITKYRHNFPGLNDVQFVVILVNKTHANTNYGQYSRGIHIIDYE